MLATSSDAINLKNQESIHGHACDTEVPTPITGECVRDKIGFEQAPNTTLIRLIPFMVGI